MLRKLRLSLPVKTPGKGEGGEDQRRQRFILNSENALPDFDLE